MIAVKVPAQSGVLVNPGNSVFDSPPQKSMLVLKGRMLLSMLMIYLFYNKICDYI